MIPEVTNDSTAEGMLVRVRVKGEEDHNINRANWRARLIAAAVYMASVAVHISRS